MLLLQPCRGKDSNMNSSGQRAPRKINFHSKILFKCGSHHCYLPILIYRKDAGDQSFDVQVFIRMWLCYQSRGCFCIRSVCRVLVCVFPVNQANVQLKMVICTTRSTTMCRHSCRWSWIDSQTFLSQEPLTILDPPPPLSETRRSWKCAIHKIIPSTWTLFINVVLSQIPDFSGKKTSKTPVKQNGPAEKSSGLPSKPQMKVRKALNSSHAPEPQPAPLVCLRHFEIYLEMLQGDIFP